MKIKKVRVGGGLHCFVECFVNGVKVDGLLDTGANITVFHPKYKNGSVIELGGIGCEYPKIHHIPFGTLAQYKKKKAPDVVIGMDILDGSIIDLKKNILSLK